ncbi:crotonase/enoyl-CoA hydratase family protein [Notoacmeibacter ruber]|uniref:Crotonase/enoyl-CoA hydratase family protein n=2 Tax=Notoacmeibacter ruber TaxID=2670375 RepID=A0A3L7JFU5_9HYPH|nr:crotonase/enoyl-CoA hydratase family protein [Notoacmeibacter ruber]RLQ89553.1 crotonase/enoyl-CoA hydratase family protein [Notoacmeibacter ruber]
MKGDFTTISVATDERGVAYLTLDRPEKKNALSAGMMDELIEFVRLVENDRSIRAVVLAGSEKTFCAGGDLGWMMTQIETDRQGRMEEARRLAFMLKAMNEMAVPLIGRVEGVAMGGGIGMACICDTAIAAEDCRFGFTETRLGIIPATISPYVLARMGEGKARRVFMSARLFNGGEAAELEIVAKAVAADQMDEAVEAEVAPYLKLPREAVGRAKHLARSLGPRIDEQVIEHTIAQLADAWETDEAREGIASFLEKRKPHWA